MQNYKPNMLAPHGPPDAGQIIALDTVKWGYMNHIYNFAVLQFSSRQRY